MEIKFAYNFKNGVTFTTKPMDVYEIHGDGDWLKLMITGKLDNQEIVVNGQKFEYNDLQSIEVIFVDD